MLTGDMLQPLLQQVFKIASHSMDTSLEMSPFVSRLIDKSAVCQITLHSDTYALGISKVSKVIQSGLLVYPFVANSFTYLLAPNLQTYMDF